MSLIVLLPYYRTPRARAHTLHRPVRNDLHRRRHSRGELGGEERPASGHARRKLAAAAAGVGAAGSDRGIPAGAARALVCRVAHHVAHHRIRLAAHRRARGAAVVPDLAAAVGAHRARWRSRRGRGRGLGGAARRVRSEAGGAGRAAAIARLSWLPDGGTVAGVGLLETMREGASVRVQSCYSQA